MVPTAQSPALQVFLKEHLLYVHTKVEAGEYADAMTALQVTKASVKDNIYVRAVEQQLVTLLDLSRRNALTDERRAEILEPITGIIERAIGTLPQVLQSTSSPAQKLSSVSLSPSLGSDEKRAALEQLKVKYFEQAGKHLSAGEYALALSEIQRVFVIEPENSTAKQYESVIVELMNLKPKGSALTLPGLSRRTDFTARSVFPPEPTTSVDPAEGDAADDAREGDPVEQNDSDVQAGPLPEAEESISNVLHDDRIPEPDGEIAPVRPEPFRAPASIHPNESRHVFSHVRSLAEEPSRRPRSKMIFAAAGVLLLCGAVAGAYTFLRGNATNPSEPGRTAESAAEQVSQEPSSPTPLISAADLNVQPESPAPSQRGAKQSVNTPSSPSAPSGEGTSRAGSRQSQDHNRALTGKVLPIAPEEVLPSTSASESPLTSEPPSSQPTASSPLAVTEPEPEPFIAVEKDPQLVKLQVPQIPDVAWQGASELRVILRVLVDADGKPVKVKVLKGDNPAIQSAAVTAVMGSTFTPGIMGKAPVTSWLTLPLKFRKNG